MRRWCAGYGWRRATRETGTIRTGRAGGVSARRSPPGAHAPGSPTLEIEVLMTDKSDQLHAAAVKVGVGGYQRHVFLCTGPSCCTPETGLAAWEQLKQTLKDRGLT